MSALAEWAEWYAAEWHVPVVELQPETKIPYPHSRGFYDASSDPLVVRERWRKRPHSNVGLVTGEVIDVIDSDHFNEDSEADEGIRLLAEASGGQSIGGGPEAWTPRPGRHFYFQASGLPTRPGFLPGIDFKARGGYVLAPPSVHPNGRTYEWWEGYGPEEPLEPLPAWLRSLIEPPEPPRLLRPVVSGPAIGNAYVRKALEGELERVLASVDGNRNTSLNTASLRLGQLVGPELSEADVESVLLEAAGAIGLGEREATRTIRSGLSAGRRTSRGVPA